MRLGRVGRWAVSALTIVIAGCGPQSPTGVDLARAMDLPEDVGAICGDPNILGRTLDRIGASGGCGIAEPVQVFAVSGVRLRPAARLNCQTAETLNGWVAGAAGPSASRAGHALSEMRVAASYACRRRNNRPSGPLSEHAKGNAIDLSAFTFADGAQATVAGDYRRGRYAAWMQEIRRAACGPFGVVLGPGSDRHHENHFHLDISNFRRPVCPALSRAPARTAATAEAQRPVPRPSRAAVPAPAAVAVPETPTATRPRPRP